MNPDAEINLETDAQPEIHRLRFLACHPKTPKPIAEDVTKILGELEMLRRIAAHVPGAIYIKAKEAAGYGTAVNPNNV